MPLIDHAIEALQGIKQHPQHASVFVSRRTGRPLVNIEMRWSRYREGLGFPTLRNHHVRPIWASRTRATGMAREDRMEVVGHVGDEVHDGYAEADLRVLRSAVNQHPVVTNSSQSGRTTTEASGE